MSHPETIARTDDGLALTDLELVAKNDELGTEELCLDCFSYVFWHLKREPWAAPREVWTPGGVRYLTCYPDEGWAQPRTFLLSHGYVLVDIPQVDDVVGYRHGADWLQFFPHWGIVAADGMIKSKFGHTNVYKHRLRQVPLEYGDAIEFFRKTEGGADRT